MLSAQPRGAPERVPLCCARREPVGRAACAGRGLCACEGWPVPVEYIGRDPPDAAAALRSRPAALPPRARRGGRVAAAIALATALAATPVALRGLRRTGLGRALLLRRLHGGGLHVLGALADELGDRSGLGADLLERSGDARLAQEVGDVAALRRDRHGDDGARGAGAGGAARAVQVRLVLHGRVDVDDELDLVDVHAARGDVGRDEHAHAALGGVGAERGEVAVARGLRQVAVQVDRRGCRLP